MREVRRSIAREARVWAIAAALAFAYLAGGYGVECWPDVRNWFSSHYGVPQ